MQLVRTNWRDWSAVVRAWRVAGWANHAWGLIPVDNLVEVWNVRPSLPGFVELLPGYAVAKGWVREGPVGWGILGPELVGTTPDEQALRVWIGIHAQMRVDAYPTHTLVRYEHRERWAEAVVEGTLPSGVYLVNAESSQAMPRDWARLARVAVEAYGLRAESANSLAESFRLMAGDYKDEFDTYFSIAGPAILTGPQAVLAAL